MTLDDMYGLTTYSPWWLIIAVVLGVLLVGWFIFLPVITKRRVRKLTGLSAAPRPIRPGEVDPVREQYRLLIQDLADRRARDEISDRALHLALSATLRDYVKIRMGIRADTMTLTDLQANPNNRKVAAVIERCYHPAFGQEPFEPRIGRPKSLDVTVREALNVVESI